MSKIGFILLTHANPEQSLRLVRGLNLLYDEPPIVCHHDFSQCALDKSLFPRNVRFVDPHYPTFWGCFSIIPATLAAIRLLMEDKSDPDWFYLLSGSDYPSSPPQNVHRLLDETTFDAFIDYREIAWPAKPVEDQESIPHGFGRPSYLSLAYKRYCAVMVPRPSKGNPMSFPPEGRSYLRHPLWRTLASGPFTAQFRCYAGEHWFTANRKAAEVLLRGDGSTMRLLEYLRRRECPEECFYHSILANANLKVSADNLRYIDWPTGDSWHPKVLTVDDLPSIWESGAHFARKMPQGSPVIEELDNRLGLAA